MDAETRTLAAAVETRIVSLAAALGAADVGGRLSTEECRLLLAAEGHSIPDQVVEAARDAIRAGEDPLGVLFYEARPPETRRDDGAVYTPADMIAPMVDWALAQQPARVIDPGAGSGRFAAAVARQRSDVDIVAIDLDPLATIMTRAALATLGHKRSSVIQGDYTTARIDRIGARTAYLGNPPYVRHHALSPKTKRWAQAAATMLGREISGLAGLHALFYLATAQHAREGDVGSFVTSSEWLDVNYGRVIRELLLQNLGGEAIYVIDPASMPFGDTATTAAITTFRLGSRPATMQLLAVPSTAHLQRLEGGQVISTDRLAAAPRWSHFLRASKPVPEGFIELGELCRVHRGAVTGSNQVWVQRPQDVDLPDDVLFPSVTRARELFEAGATLESLDKLRVVVDLPEDLDALDAASRRRVKAFLKRATAAGVRSGYIASYRRAWWRVGLRDPAPILATYMARRAPTFVRNQAGARHINIAHGLYPRVELPPIALDRLAESLRRSVTVDGGRTYAGGLTKFEPKEMERIRVPDLSVLTA